MPVKPDMLLFAEQQHSARLMEQLRIAQKAADAAAALRNENYLLEGYARCLRAMFLSPNDAGKVEAVRQFESHHMAELGKFWELWQHLVEAG